MTDEATTETIDTPAEPGVSVEPATSADAAPTGLRRTTGGQTLFDRFISPVVLPIAAVAAIVFVVVNLSRVYLAGVGGAHEDGAEAAAESGGHPLIPVVVAAIVTLSILAFASAFAAAKKMRRHTLGIFSVITLATVAFAGWLSVGDAQEKKEESSFVPCDAPTSELTVEALASVKFDRSSYTLAAGCTTISFTGASGHTLVFEEPPPAPFPKFGALGAATYELSAGEYTIYCDVTGHRDQGMVATLTVTGDGTAPAEGAAPAE